MNHPVAPPRDTCLRPLFIIGTERSGSNLLRLVLNTHSNLFIPHPPHVMKLMKPFERAYATRFREMAADVCALVRSHTFPWEVDLDVDRVLEACRGERDLFSVYAAVHELYRRTTGKARWGCKSTFMINETDRILREFPQAQLIHLVRDPRDVAVSARASVFNHFHPWYVAQLWAREQQKAIRLHETLPPERITRLHYEDLLADPEGCIRGLCAFLGEDYEPAMLSFFDTDEARKSASLCHDWRNTGTGFLQGNTRKFLRALSRDEVAVIEGVAETQMSWFGYPFVTDSKTRRGALHPAPWTRAGYAVKELGWQLQAEWKSLRSDRNYPLRVRKWLLLRWFWLKSLLR